MSRLRVLAALTVCLSGVLSAGEPRADVPHTSPALDGQEVPSLEAGADVAPNSDFESTPAIPHESTTSPPLDPSPSFSDDGAYVVPGHSAYRDGNADSYGSGRYDGTDSYGTDSYGTDSYGTDSYGTDSYGTDSTLPRYTDPTLNRHGFEDGRFEAAPGSTIRIEPQHGVHPQGHRGSPTIIHSDSQTTIIVPYGNVYVNGRRASGRHYRARTRTPIAAPTNLGVGGSYPPPPAVGGYHVRYPYYSYRRPWYSAGPPSFNRSIIW